MEASIGRHMGTQEDAITILIMESWIKHFSLYVLYYQTCKDGNNNTCIDSLIGGRILLCREYLSPLLLWTYFVFAILYRKYKRFFSVLQ
jgi:hypothetical protein